MIGDEAGTIGMAAECAARPDAKKPAQLAGFYSRFR
jgi:hypothetical protein